MKRSVVFAACLWVSCLFTLSAQKTTIESKEENSLRVMSYNVRNCRGMDEVIDYQRVADIMNRVDPDVIAVQELDSASVRNNGVFALKELADRTRMFYTYGPSIDYQGGKYGIGILSKEKPIRHWMVPLPGREESRLLLIAEFDKYVMCCSHFSLTKEDQVLSVPIIFDALKDIRKPVFLAGDMNSEQGSPTQNELQKKFIPLNSYKANTIPSKNPNRCIDFIYGFDNGNQYSVLWRQVLDEPVASDHLPLFVDVRLKAGVADIFRTKPYLQNPTGNGITVSWFTNVPVHAWVEYGTSSDLDKRAEVVVDGQIICNNKHHKVRLTDLEPGATYHYRVCSREITLYEAYKKEFGETAYSDIYSFTMPSTEVTDFTALIFNDLHKRNEVLDLLADQVEEVDYDFVMFNGDCIDDPRNESEAVHFLSYMNSKVKAENVPVFYLRGNHEIRNAYSIQLRELFDYVGNKTYGAFNWGDTRFVILDCGEDKPDSTWVYYGLNDFMGLRMEQVGFLKAELSGKAYKKATKKVLMHHIPLYGMSEKSYLPCLDLWGSLLAKAPFDVSINAHTHRFAYWPKGSVGNNFPVVIGGGNRPENATVMILSKKGTVMTLKALNTKGETLQIINL